MDEDKTFLGTGWCFPPQFRRRPGESRLAAQMVSAEEDIRESLRILMATSPGERVMQPGYGCGLKELVFEHVTESLKTEIRDRIERAVLFFEPRITLNRVGLDSSSMSEGLLRIELDYTVRATNSRSNVVYPFYFLEGTNIRQGRGPAESGKA